MKFKRKPRLKDLKKRRKLYRKYLIMKVAEEDWHGVADAAMDLRELDVAIYERK